MFSSRMQILTVEKTESKTIDEKTGKPFERVACRVILLSDGNEVVTVGRLRVPKVLIPQVKPGVFRAAFALKVPDYGDNKGDVVAELTSLTEEVKASKAAQ